MESWLSSVTKGLFTVILYQSGIQFNKRAQGCGTSQILSTWIIWGYPDESGVAQGVPYDAEGQSFPEAEPGWAAWQATLI